MKKGIKILLIIILFCIVLLVYSKNHYYKESQVKVSDSMEKNTVEENSNPAQLTLWVHFEGWESMVSDFNAQNPDMNIKIETFDFGEYTDKCLTALAQGKGPDLIYIDSSEFGEFNGTEAFQDLLQPPFNGGRYKTDFKASLWNAVLSFDKRRLLAIPLSSTPMVTFYRKDIMEQYGFPSEPEALGEYMEDPNNWLNIARVLKKDKKYIAQWAYDPISILDGGQADVYDDELNLLIDRDEFRKAMDLSKTISEERLSLEKSIWDYSGQTAINNNELAMLYMGTWGVDTIKGWAPDQEGKWAITKLPFGINGWENSAFIAINAKSKHKEEAWRFIQSIALNPNAYYVSGPPPAYLPTLNNPKMTDYSNDYLGGQNTLKFFKSLINETEERPSNPLSKEADRILWDRIRNGLNKNMSTDEIINDVKQTLDSSLGREKELLLKSIETKNNNK